MSSGNRLKSFAVALLLAMSCVALCSAAAGNGEGNLATPSVNPAESSPGQ